MPFLGPYTASKFGLEGLAESLRRELMLFGIDVVIVAPGAVATPIWDKADAQDLAPFADTPYAPALEKVKKYMIAEGRKGLPPERLGQTVKTALTVPRPRTRYTVTPEPLQNWIVTVLPKRWLDSLIGRRLALKP